MTATMQSARGASAYTQTDSRTFRKEEVPSFQLNKRDTSYDNNWSKIIDVLLGFRNLEDDWDGAGTPAPQFEIVDKAIILALFFKEHNFMIPSRAHVSVNGTICMEWHSQTNYQEVEVISPNEAEFTTIDRFTEKTEIIELKLN